MCEWLSCREWCDVRLQCGGRSFGAHRAVLASVSAFLQRILLSCPTEDSPTFIILPDFDLDAMSSVLYYIYNGEVVIQKQKLEMFIEIAKAMQIFVDKQYLPNVCDSDEDLSWPSKIFNQRISAIDAVFCLGDNADKSYVNLKKGINIDCKLLTKSLNVSNFANSLISCKDWSKLVVGNMESVNGDRQRSFIRDLFMETDPQNGNANGRAASVLAIQSARYRAPASVLLTNANGRHLRVNDMPEMHKKSLSLPTWFSDPSCLRQQNFTSNYNYSNEYSSMVNCAELAQFKKLNSAFSYFNPKYLLRVNPPKKDSKGQTESEPNLDFTNVESHLRLNNLSHVTSAIADNTLHERIIDDNNLRVNLNQEKSHKQTNNGTNGSWSKAAVLNEVLDSPWRPRQPTSYRPFRKKVQDTTSTSLDMTKKTTLNDDNNNIRASLSPDAIERISANASIVDLPYSIARVPVGSDFKCLACDQVFTSSEALTSHARCHTSPARYSCTECSKSFSQLRNFKYHMSVHRGTREFAATCTVCGKYFNDRGYLSSHMKIHRNRKEYKCSQCPKSFNQRVAYNMHVRIHTGVKPHVCNECGKAFSRKMLLKQHQRTHSGERPYACPHCDKRFADRSNMTLHLRLHTGIKPFSCTLCPKSFTKKHHLKSHLNFHTGAKPYSCPKCRLAFTQSSNMRTHLKKCTAPEPDEKAETQSS